jgi:hypothetical protein
VPADIRLFAGKLIYLSKVYELVPPRQQKKLDPFLSRQFLVFFGVQYVKFKGFELARDVLWDSAEIPKRPSARGPNLTSVLWSAGLERLYLDFYNQSSSESHNTSIKQVLSYHWGYYFGLTKL